MYCPICGAHSAQGLNYCKKCGYNLAAQPQDAASQVPPKITGAVWPIALAAVAITLGGLAIVVSTAFDLMRPLFPGEMPRVGDPSPVVVAMLVLGAGTIVAVVAMLIRLFMKLAGMSQPEKSKAPPQNTITSAPPMVQLPAPQASMPSVTEHTTRNFDAVYKEPGRREDEWNRR
jgi:hypothetical protein